MKFVKKIIFEKKISVIIRLLLIVILCNLFLYANLAIAQNWEALPPYNTLWPLWSPALSPINAATGLPTPLVSSLAPDTMLPVMPGLTWDPAMAYPWLLYNSPIGMVSFDPLLGIDTWPPKYLTQGKTPAPITLPFGYDALPPTPSSILKTLVPPANLAYLAALPSLALPFGGPVPTTAIVPPPPLSSLLTAANIIGIGPAGTAMLAIPPLPPIPLLPPPTLAIPAPTAAISALSFLLPSIYTSLPSTITGGGTVAVAPVITNWSGLWISLLNTSQLGPMSLTLSQNTTTGATTGTLSLILNKLVPLPVTVSGVFLGGTTLTLTGVFTDYQLALSGLIIIPVNYNVTLNCTITSATTMSGTYSILSLKENDFGNFNISLI